MIFRSRYANHRGGLLALRHELHPHRLFYFLLRLEGDSLSVPSPKLDRHFLADRAMCIELDLMFLVWHAVSSFFCCLELQNRGILQNTTRRDYATASTTSSTLFYNGLVI
jgi:hypothetical protein